MRAGELRHRIEIKEPVETRDSYGSVTISWQTLDTVWAAMWPLKVKEYVGLGQTQSELTHRVRIRFRDDVTTKMRLEFKERTMSIVQIINPDERNIMLEMLCKKEID